MKTKILLAITLFIVIIGTALAIFTPNLKNHNNSSQPSAAANTGCIITVEGQKYDITSLRSEHPGGDIFRCGEDIAS